MAVLQFQTKERRKASINHPSCMFQLFGVRCKCKLGMYVACAKSAAKGAVRHIHRHLQRARGARVHRRHCQLLTLTASLKLPGPIFVVPFLDLLWVLVRFMVRNPQKELQIGGQVPYHNPIGLPSNTHKPTLCQTQTHIKPTINPSPRKPTSFESSLVFRQLELHIWLGSMRRIGCLVIAGSNRIFHSAMLSLSNPGRAGGSLQSARAGKQ